MNPDSSVGRIMTVEEAEKYFTRVVEAEKAMGPLTEDERMVILRTLGEDITSEELQDLLKGKKVLHIKAKEKGE